MKSQTSFSQYSDISLYFQTKVLKKPKQQNLYRLTQIPPPQPLIDDILNTMNQWAALNKLIF